MDVKKGNGEQGTGTREGADSVVQASSVAIDGSRDLQSVDASCWPVREFPASVQGRTSSVPVVIRQSILNHIHRHGQQHSSVEICGVLVGRGYRDAAGPYVYLEGAIRGDHADNQTAQVTFTSETWNHINAVLDNAFPEQRILGWYHTHPGFGIFLSGMDLFIHDNFFNTPEQFAIVYDPLSGDEGIFLWNNGKAERAGFLIEPDEPEDPPQRPGGSKLIGATAGAGAPSDRPDAVQALRGQVRTLQALVLLFVLLAIMWPIVLYQLYVAPQLNRPADSGVKTKIDLPRK